MPKQDRCREKVERFVQFLRLPFLITFLWLIQKTTCTSRAAWVQGILLFLWAALPGIRLLSKKQVFADRTIRLSLPLLGFAIISILNVLAVYRQGTPLFFPLFPLLALEAGLLWGQSSALITGATAGTILAALGWAAILPLDLAIAPAAISLAWAMLLSYGLRFIPEPASVNLHIPHHTLHRSPFTTPTR